MTETFPPSNLEAERCAIAALMLAGDNRALFASIRRQLVPASFLLLDHATLFRVLCEMADKGSPVDAVLLVGELRARGVLDDIGGTAYIATLLQSIPSPVNGPHYAQEVAEQARRRDAIAVAMGIARKLTEQTGESAANVIQSEIGKLWTIATAGRDLQVWRLRDAISRFVDMRINGERKIAMCSGINTLDRNFLGVFTLGGYTLIAARPSQGKSTIIRWMLTGLAKAGTPVGLIAVEENEDKIAGNVLSSESEIENSHLAYSEWNVNEEATIAIAAAALHDVPFFGVDTAMNLADVLTAAEVLVTQHGCRVIAVDHVHLIDSHRGRNDNREQQISEISAALKSLFKRLKVTGIVAAQLNRPEKGQCPPPPHLTDLRGSGALEEHADAVLMLHRKDYYYRGTDHYVPDHKAQVLVRKNRNGCVGEIVLRAELQYQRFAEQAQNPFDQEAM